MLFVAVLYAGKMWSLAQINLDRAFWRSLRISAVMCSGE